MITLIMIPLMMIMGFWICFCSFSQPLRGCCLPAGVSTKPWHLLCYFDLAVELRQPQLLAHPGYGDGVGHRQEHYLGGMARCPVAAGAANRKPEGAGLSCHVGYDHNHRALFIVHHDDDDHVRNIWLLSIFELVIIHNEWFLPQTSWFPSMIFCFYKIWWLLILPDTK